MYVCACILSHMHHLNAMHADWPTTLPPDITLSLYITSHTYTLTFLWNPFAGKWVNSSFWKWLSLFYNIDWWVCKAGNPYNTIKQVIWASHLQDMKKISDKTRGQLVFEVLSVLAISVFCGYALGKKKEFFNTSFCSKKKKKKRDRPGDQLGPANQLMQV